MKIYFFFQAEDGIRVHCVTGVQTCALPILVNHNFLEVDDLTGKYQLGFACLELARSYQTASELLRVARPLLRRLRDSTKETVHLAALDGLEGVYLEKMYGVHARSDERRVGREGSTGWWIKQ